MNRRAFLRSLLLAPVAAPIAVEAAVKAPAGLWAWWRARRARMDAYNTLGAWARAMRAEVSRVSYVNAFLVLGPRPPHGGDRITVTRLRSLAHPVPPKEVMPRGSRKAHAEEGPHAHADAGGQEGREEEVAADRARRSRGVRA